MRTICSRPSLYFGLAIVILLSLACGVLPTSNPEVEVKAAFEKWASQAGVPYKDVSYQTIKNDDTFATVRVQATLKQSATEDWLTKQVDIECRHVGSEWQCGSAFVFSLTEAEQARQAQIASGTATAAAIKLQATATEYARQAEATRQALVATQIVVKQNADATATAVALGATATALAPRPTTILATNAGKIVFDSPVNGKWQVFSVNPDGTSLKQLTSIANGIGDPAIAPDGTRIVFVGDDGKRLYTMTADGTQMRSVYETNVEAGWPSWSSDSTKIVFASRINGHKSLFVMNADGTGVTQLTDSPTDDVAPAFSPDGNKVAFSSNRSGTWEIYTLTIASGEIVKLTSLGDPIGQGWPSWSPDGLSITFESGDANKRSVYTMNADGTQVGNITKNHPGNNGAPVWSPDGKWIAFFSNREGLDIYIMRSDGTEVRRLTRIWAWGPSWSSQQLLPTLAPTPVLPTSMENTGKCPDARLVAHVTVPDNSQFDKSKEFVKAWRVRNVGSCDWPEGTLAAYAAGEKMDAPDVVKVGTLKVGDTVEISVPMRSPDKDGKFRATWRLMDALGNLFGEEMTVLIVVGQP
jgi:hypothetical protein